MSKEKVKSPKASSSPRTSKDDGDDSKAESGGSSKPPYRVDPRGDQFMKEAEKKLSKSSIMGFFSGGANQKYEDAIELILKAAAQYKVSKNWQQAGDAYVKAGEIYEKNLKEAHDARSRYVDAAKAYKNVDTKAAVKYYSVAVDMDMEGNRFSTAAKLYKDIAELYEKELDYENAKNAYMRAADCYESEDSSANATSCLVKVAQLSAELEDYKKAIEIYEKISAKALEGSNAGKWGVKDYLFKSLLCHLVLAAKKNSIDDLQPVIDRYKDMLPQLDGTREVKLIEDLVNAFREDDMDLYSDTVFRYDEIYKLDNWTAKVLLEVKNIMKNGPEGAKEEDFS